MINLKFKTLGKNELVTIQGGNPYLIGAIIGWGVGKVLDGVWTVVTETDPRKWNQPGSTTASGSKA